MDARYEAREQTAAKHSILSKYLEALAFKVGVFKRGCTLIRLRTPHAARRTYEATEHARGPHTLSLQSSAHQVQAGPRNAPCFAARSAPPALRIFFILRRSSPPWMCSPWIGASCYRTYTPSLARREIQHDRAGNAR
jgi:hypothetical protein